MRAMILAAGLGTRLRPLTDELPKPLVPVGDRSMLAHVGERLRAAGIASAVVNTHHLPEAFDVARLAEVPVEVTLVHEPEILGTGGGLANAASLLGPGDVLVWNSDILAELDLEALRRAHESSGALATLAVAPRPRGEGTVGLARDGRVARLRGERFAEETSGGDFVGVQIVGAELRGRLPKVGCLVGDGYLPALRGDERVRAVALVSAWDDVGSLAAYRAANARWLAARGLSSFVAEGARVAEGIELERAVIGRGAVLTGRGLVRDVVLWPEGTAVAPLESAVATATGRVVHVQG